MKIPTFMCSHAVVITHSVSRKVIYAFLPIVFFMSVSTVTFGQQTITGKVTDADGNGLPGVSVILKGTATGTTTDADGNYAIEVPSTDGILVFTFVGFNSQEIAIGSRAIIDVSVSEDMPDPKLLRYWCCTDHAAPDGPHRGLYEDDLKEEFGCKTYKRCD